MKQYIVSFLLFLFLLTGCSGKEETIAHIPATPAPLPQTEIPMNKFANRTFAYNPSENSLSMWTCKKRTYQMYTLKKDNQWFGPIVSWKAPKNSFYDNFSYGSDGSLYACQKSFRGQTLQSQSLIRLRKNKTVCKIPLVQLPKKEITHISFSGTALALTFADNSVRFYNIAEGQAFGDSHIHGSLGKNILQKYWYITQESKEGEMCLKSYDIRTGESQYTFPLGANQTVPFSNYREKLYLLLPGGIYTGSTENAVLQKQVDFSSLNLPSDTNITFFQAARDDTLYLGFYDKEQIYHLRIVTLSPLCYTNRQKTT